MSLPGRTQDPAWGNINTSCPEYKVVAVDVRPVAEQPAYTPALREPPLPTR